jgi:pimeloyl-ACP methyl ester carboxylesterase
MRAKAYRFGEFCIDTARFEIACGGRALPVEPQVLELLIVLIENRDQVVTREELLEKVWSGRVVSDTTLSSRVKTARQLIGDDGTRQRYIRTVHGRGFRFVGAVEEQERAEAASPRVAAGDRPTTRYAKSGDVHVAYQCFGSGPVNLVLAPGFVSHIENYWDNPRWGAWLARLGELARVAIFDKRGTGLSDQVASLPGMDERMDDLRAVMDAVGFETAFVMGISEGGSLAALFTAHHQARCDGLILYGAFAQFKHWFADQASLQKLFDYAESEWGSGKSLPQFAPSVADDPELMRWWGKFERLGATPGAVISLMKMNSRIDISDVLPAIRVPTLVIHRTDDVLIDVEAGRSLAAHIPGAQYVELPGVDHLPFVGNAERVLEAVEGFLSGPRTRERSSRVVTTILLLRLSGQPPTEVEQLLCRYRATRLSVLPATVTATFDGPARALECAASVSRLLRQRAVDHRIGIHTGEINLEAAALEGPAMDIAADVAGHAQSAEVLVSRTVNDLVAGSDIALRDRGEFRLPSIGQHWHLFRVDP